MTDKNTGASSRPSKSEQRRLRKILKRENASSHQQVLQTSPEDLNPDFSAASYGTLPLCQSQSRGSRERAQISTLSSHIDEIVLIRARIHKRRKVGNKLVFLDLRQRTHLIQAVIAIEDEMVSPQMVRWAAKLAHESIVLVEGAVRKSSAPVRSVTVGGIELGVTQIHLIATIDGRLPFDLEDASRSDAEIERTSQFTHILPHTRLNNRVLDLRTQTNQALFTLQAAIGDLFRSYLQNQSFIEIHTPRLLSTPGNRGSVFQFNYFEDIAYLARSPQFANQMAISGDFERVYEVGPVFNAEPASANITESTDLNLEMVIEEHCDEIIEMFDGLLLNIFRNLKENYKHELETVRKQFPSDDFKWKEGSERTIRLTYREALQVLNDEGGHVEPVSYLSVDSEYKLNRLIRAKYDTDYFIIDKYPTELCTFDMMPDADDPTVSNSFCFFIRGQTILSGAQHIHDPKLLVERMQHEGIDPQSMKTYVDAFRMGCAPHGGGEIKLERLVRQFLRLNNFRFASLFPRDPNRGLEP